MNVANIAGAVLSFALVLFVGLRPLRHVQVDFVCAQGLVGLCGHIEVGETDTRQGGSPHAARHEGVFIHHLARDAAGGELGLVGRLGCERIKAIGHGQRRSDEHAQVTLAAHRQTVGADFVSLGLGRDEFALYRKFAHTACKISGLGLGQGFHLESHGWHGALESSPDTATAIKECINHILHSGLLNHLTVKGDAGHGHLARLVGEEQVLLHHARNHGAPAYLLSNRLNLANRDFLRDDALEVGFCSQRYIIEADMGCSKKLIRQQDGLLFVHGGAVNASAHVEVFVTNACRGLPARGLGRGCATACAGRIIGRAVHGDAHPS